MHPQLQIDQATRRGWLQRAGAAVTVPFGVSLLLAGCASQPAATKPPQFPPSASAPPPKPMLGEIALTLRVVAAPHVNPDARGRPSPLLLRFYALRSARAFDAGDFMSLYQRDAQVLGDDLLAREEVMVVPGSSVVVSRAVPGTARILAVLAAFRVAEQARWRNVVAMPAGSAPRLTLQADRLSVLFSEAG